MDKEFFCLPKVYDTQNAFSRVKDKPSAKKNISYELRVLLRTDKSVVC